MTQLTLYQQVVATTHTYLGPAADRFIARQVQNHLKKQPDKLSEKDLASLIDWIQIAVSLLTEDSKIIEEYVTELRILAENTNRHSHRARNKGKN